MPCDKFQEFMLDHILEELDSSDAMEFGKHIASCRACRMEYEQIQSAVEALKPGAEDALSLVEKLRLENTIYAARLRRLSGGRLRNVWIQRLTATAAAVLIFLLGYSLKTMVPNGRSIHDAAPANEKIEARIDPKLVRQYGQRISSRGLLLIAKGEKALDAYKLRD